MKKVVVAVTTAVAVMGTVVPAVQAAEWTGAYGGLTIGYAWGDIDLGVDPDPTFGPFGEPYCEVMEESVGILGDGYFSGCGYLPKALGDVSALASSLDNAGSISADGATFGLTLGINQQAGNFVYGIEFEAGMLGLDETVLSDNPVASAFGRAGTVSAEYVSCSGGCEGPVDLFGVDTPSDPYQIVNVDGGLYLSAALRLGYAFGNTMVYAKGGVGGADLGVSIVNDISFDGSACFNTNDPNCLTGRSENFTDAYVYGLGVEHQISPSWSVKVEYLKFDFDESQIFVHNTDGVGYLYTVDADVDTVKIGMNWRFGHL